MRRLPAAAVLGIVLTLAGVRPAQADATAFVGATTTPVNRTARGVSISLGLVIVAFEFEYASTSADTLTPAPSLQTGMGNGILQTPVMIFGLQPYLTAGGGIYRERLNAHSETNVALNTGGGVKIALAGPLRLRVDYRVFKLGGGALYTPAHRIYAGLNLKF